MTSPATPSSDPSQEPAPSHTGLKITVIVLGVLLVVGFAIVFTTIVYRIFAPADPAQSAAPVRGYFGELAVPVPEGAQIEDMVLNEDKLAVHLTRAGDGERIVLIDIRRGAVLGVVKPVPETAGAAPVPAE